MTTPFVSAAELMSRVLGAEGFSFAVIDHPISSASQAQLSEQARHMVARAKALLLAPAGGV